MVIMGCNCPCSWANTGLSQIVEALFRRDDRPVLANLLSTIDACRVLLYKLKKCVRFRWVQPIDISTYEAKRLPLKGSTPMAIVTNPLRGLVGSGSGSLRYSTAALILCSSSGSPTPPRGELWGLTRLRRLPVSGSQPHHPQRIPGPAGSDQPLGWIQLEFPPPCYDFDHRRFHQSQRAEWGGAPGL